MSVFINDGHTADVVAFHHIQSLAHGAILANRHRIDDHARFRTLHFVYFFSLAFNAQVFMNDSDAALLRDRDCQCGFGNGVHRR